MKKIRLIFVYLICLWLTTDASALEINLLSESYHIAGYIQSGWTGPTLDSYDYTSSCPLSGSVSYVLSPNHEYSSGESSASRFQVKIDLYAPLGQFPFLYPLGIDWDHIHVDGLAEATWSFQIPTLGEQIVALNFTNGSKYYDGSIDDEAAFVSISKNGALYDSFYLPGGFNVASEITLGGNTPGDVWELTFKTENLVWKEDRARASISADLHTVPEPSTVLLLGAGLLGLVGLRWKLRK